MRAHTGLLVPVLVALVVIWACFVIVKTAYELSIWPL